MRVLSLAGANVILTQDKCVTFARLQTHGIPENFAYVGSRSRFLSGRLDFLEPVPLLMFNVETFSWTYQGFPHAQFVQCDGHILRCRWASQSWWHVSHCRYPVLGLPPVTVGNAVRVGAPQKNHTPSNWTSKATHSCGNHNGATPRAELVKRLLAIPLRTVAMDTGAGIALAIQEIL